MNFSTSPLCLPPLAGRRILTTRPKTFWCAAGELDILDGCLREWGAEVSRIPLVEIGPVPFDLPLPPPDWLFFTSQNAVRAFFDAWQACESPLPESWRTRSIPIGVVGPATAKTLEGYGRTAAFVSPRFEAAEAAKAFMGKYPCAGLRIGWPCGNLADPGFAALLTEAGATVTPWIVYETRLKKTLTPDESVLLANPVDMIVLTSPSAVTALAGLIPVVTPDGVNVRTVIACLGPQTARSAKEQLGRVDVQALPHTLDALAEAIRRFYASS